MDAAQHVPNRKIVGIVIICFFLSGFAGLIYEILWTRMIVKIIGGAPFAVSIVVAVFMGGLGLGSYLAGRAIDRIKAPMNLVVVYGALQIVIAAYGLALPLPYFWGFFKPCTPFYIIISSATLCFTAS